MITRKNGTEAAGAGLEVDAKVPSPALARSVSLHLDGKRKDALRELNTAIEKGEETPEVFTAKGHIQFELEQYEEAIRTYEKLLALAPRHSTANFNLGICYEKLGRWQDAAHAFQKTLDADPRREEAQLGLGICLLHLEKPEPAQSSPSIRFSLATPIMKRRCSARLYRCNCSGSLTKLPLCMRESSKRVLNPRNA